MTKTTRATKVTNEEIWEDRYELMSLYPNGITSRAISDFYGLGRSQGHHIITSKMINDKRWEVNQFPRATLSSTFKKSLSDLNPSHKFYSLWVKGEEKNKFYGHSLLEKQYFILRALLDNSQTDENKGVVDNDLYNIILDVLNTTSPKLMWNRAIDDGEIKAKKVSASNDIDGLKYKVIMTQADISKYMHFDKEYEYEVYGT